MGLSRSIVAALLELEDEAPTRRAMLLLLPEEAVGSDGIEEVFVRGAVSGPCAGVPDRDADRCVCRTESALASVSIKCCSNLQWQMAKKSDVS